MKKIYLFTAVCLIASSLCAATNQIHRRSDDPETWDKAQAALKTAGLGLEIDWLMHQRGPGTFKEKYTIVFKGLDTNTLKTTTGGWYGQDFDNFDFTTLTKKERPHDLHIEWKPEFITEPEDNPQAWKNTHDILAKAGLDRKIVLLERLIYNREISYHVFFEDMHEPWKMTWTVGGPQNEPFDYISILFYPKNDNQNWTPSYFANGSLIILKPFMNGVTTYDQVCDALRETYGEQIFLSSEDNNFLPLPTCFPAGRIYQCIATLPEGLTPAETPFLWAEESSPSGHIPLMFWNGEVSWQKLRPPDLKQILSTLKEKNQGKELDIRKCKRGMFVPVRQRGEARNSGGNQGQTNEG